MSHYYSLSEIRSLIAQGKYYLTTTARLDALNMGFDNEDVCNCIQELRETHFYKSMPADKVPGLWQDVYKITFEDARIYLKLQINRSRTAVVISFKRDTAYD